MTGSPRQQRAQFSPRFTVGLLYLFGFFFFYCMLFALPDMFEVLRNTPEGPEQQEAAMEAVRTATSRHLPYAVVASLITVSAGVWTRALPGMRG